MADPMRALPGPCGASLGSEGPPKGQKYAFGTQKHPFREISRNYENRNSKIFGHESGARLSWASCTDLRSFGRLAAAVEPYPGWSVYEKFAGAVNVRQGNVFWRLRFLECRYPGCAPRNASARLRSPEASCGCLGHCPGTRGIPQSLKRYRFKSNLRRPECNKQKNARAGGLRGSLRCKVVAASSWRAPRVLECFVLFCLTSASRWV